LSTTCQYEVDFEFDFGADSALTPATPTATSTTKKTSTRRRNSLPSRFTKYVLGTHCRRFGEKALFLEGFMLFLIREAEPGALFGGLLPGRRGYPSWNTES
jgi:hypothetical protein